ncbi:hypothetical protein SCLCIDRAFT_115632 [Scleroderma citrinum Foug A]|uniref:Uncharacterized protein n=1 Tax=Scleroderma citrinum Foug A TaxID=1036808 RepID=A0A0C2ZRS0_9AGAM|nr:hypothetical protein SCLCIDRAFT_115632 [Scleroderma citrinum Foug A]
MKRLDWTGLRNTIHNNETPEWSALPKSHSHSPRFVLPPTLPPAQSSSNPLPYCPGLTPSLSPLHPHCLAKDHLLHWKPFESTDGNPSHAHPILSEAEADFEWILSIIDASWGSNTKASYGTGLLVFHVFCNSCNVPEIDRCPVSQLLLLLFISTCTGTYSSNTLANYITGVHAWHMLHGRPWLLNSDTLKATIEGVACLALPSAKHPQCDPFTLDIITLFKSQLSPDDPLEAAVFTCIAVCFWGIVVGEFTVPSINAFNPAKHITCAGLSQVTDWNSLLVFKFHLPWTKTSRASGNGESVQCAQQNGPTDPIAMLKNHFCINAVAPNEHLFS